MFLGLKREIHAVLLLTAGDTGYAQASQRTERSVETDAKDTTK